MLSYGRIYDAGISLRETHTDCCGLNALTKKTKSSSCIFWKDRARTVFIMSMIKLSLQACKILARLCEQGEASG